MATTSLKSAYGTANQPLTITLNSLGASAARSSVPIDNTGPTLGFLDALVTVKMNVSAGGGANVACTVYAYGSTDGGSTYGGGETGMGTDATVTLTSPANLQQIGVINITSNTTFQRTFSVASAFGTVLPAQWGIVVGTPAGVTLAATANSANYQGSYVTNG